MPLFICASPAPSRERDTIEQGLQHLLADRLLFLFVFRRLYLTQAVGQEVPPEVPLELSETHKGIILL